MRLVVLPTSFVGIVNASHTLQPSPRPWLNLTLCPINTCQMNLPAVWFSTLLLCRVRDERAHTRTHPSGTSIRTLGAQTHTQATPSPVQ